MEYFLMRFDSSIYIKKTLLFKRLMQVGNFGKFLESSNKLT